MCKFILMVLLAVVSCSATAKWVRVGSTDYFVSYVDSDTIRKSGTKVKMWDMFDSKTAQLSGGKPYLSTKERYEYDCKEERSRMLFFSNHAEKMGKGKIISSAAKPDEWIPVSAGSVRQALWKYACGKR